MISDCRYTTKCLQLNVLVMKDNEDFCHHNCPFIYIDFKVVGLNLPIKVTAHCNLFRHDKNDELIVYINEYSYDRFKRGEELYYWEWAYFCRHIVCKKFTGG
jgi:hypothetical protein